MGKADLHAHTCHDAWCDGNQSVADLFRYVQEQTDLDVFGITDHDNTTGARAAWELYRQGGYRFEFMPGVEVTNQAGHLLCYFPSGQIIDIPSLRPFWWTVRYAQAHGAICIPAHAVFPPWLGATIRHGMRRGHGIDALEVVNAGIPAKAQHRLHILAHGFSGTVAQVGNSDAHHQQAVGSAYTDFPGHTLGDYLAALQNRTTRPVFVERYELDAASRAFTTRRSMTRPGWVRNLWQEAHGGLN